MALRVAWLLRHQNEDARRLSRGVLPSERTVHSGSFDEFDCM